MPNDDFHLKILSICHYVLAGLSALFSCVFLIHFFWGWSVLHGNTLFPMPPKDAPPPQFGYMLMAMGCGAVLAGWSFAAALVIAGRSITKRRWYIYCLIVAGLSSVMCNPLGTVLGVFTFVVLLRPSVKELFVLQTGRSANDSPDPIA